MVPKSHPQQFLARVLGPKSISQLSLPGRALSQLLVLPCSSVRPSWPSLPPPLGAWPSWATRAPPHSPSRRLGCLLHQAEGSPTCSKGQMWVCLWRFTLKRHLASQVHHKSQPRKAPLLSECLFAFWPWIGRSWKVWKRETNNRGWNVLVTLWTQIESQTERVVIVCAFIAFEDICDLT